MSIKPPGIDNRDQQVLVEQIRKLLLQYCPEWKDIASIESDKLSGTLIQVFSRMMEIIIQRLNKVPDRNFLSFLDLMGVRLSPPRVARSPLTFTMATGASQYGFVPAGTQVAGTQAKDQDAVVFETEKNLTVILPKLVKVVSLNPEDDRWTDHSPVFFDNTGKDAEALFKGKNLVPHRLYLGHNDLFSFKEQATITLNINVRPLKKFLKRENIRGSLYYKMLRISRLTARTPDLFSVKNDFYKGLKLKKDITLNDWEVKWYYYSDDSSEPMPLPVSGDIDVVNLLKSGKITFQNVSGIPERTLTGFEKKTGMQKSWTGTWIFAELNKPISEAQLPEINTIKATVEIKTESDSSLSPDLAFFNNLPLDLTKDFYPFGEKPKFNDTFYIGSEEVFSKETAEITIAVTLSDVSAVPVPNTNNIIKLGWEFWNGNSWETIWETTEAGVSEPPGGYNFKDTTNAFTITGEVTVTFKCPKIEPTELTTINAEESYWIRVRIIGGDYGKEATYEEKSVVDASGNLVIDASGNEVTAWTYKPPTFKPPSINSFKMQYIFEPSEKNLQTVLTYNDFLYQDQGDICKTSDQFFMPFQSVSDREPALYLAFDRDISNLPGTIFFPLIAKDFTPPLEGQSQLPPVLAWEYWNGYTWSTLTVEDNTKNLTKREMVQFLSPGDLKRKACFGEDYYWIRARAEKGKYAIQPQLKGVYSNTVWAYNQITVNDEILGSSNGQSNQVFKIAHSPVLSGATILVKESAVTEKDRETIISEEGEDAIKEVRDDAGNILETWVRWHEVGHFYFSEPYSRHFIIDRNKGTITFGDGIKGMIPQAGKDNIKCGQYRYGGGTQGNVGKRIVTKLRTSIPYIDEVTNPAAAEGGVDQESMDDVRIRGPRTIKTRNRAVTFEDFEWITQEASPKVARVKCLPATNPAKQFKPGWVTLIIVPESEDVKPLPTAELLSEIEKYLFTRTAGYLTTLVPLQQINLIPPNYIRVDVEAVVDIQSITEARIIEARILDRLQRFFHPLHGGPKGNGWDFGRNVYITEIYEVIERVEGVNYVIDATLKASEQIYKVRLDKTISSSYSFPDHSRVSFDRDKIIFSLAEKLPKDKEIDTLKVLGFMEGDRIEIRHEDEKEVIKRATFLVKSVSGNVLECESVEVDGTFPIGSIVETYLKSPDQTIKSYLISGIKANSEISQLHVAIPDAGDDFILIHRDWPSNTIHGKITDVDDTVETVYLEDNYLVYSGTHAIWNTEREKGGKTLVPAGAGTKGNENLISPFKGGINGGFSNKKKREEAVFQYLVNTNTGEIHNLNTIQPRCNISAIHDKNKKFITSLKEVSMEIEKGVYDYCAWCFDRKMSKR